MIGRWLSSAAIGLCASDSRITRFDLLDAHLLSLSQRAVRGAAVLGLKLCMYSIARGGTRLLSPPKDHLLVPSKGLAYAPYGNGLVQGLVPEWASGSVTEVLSRAHS